MRSAQLFPVVVLLLAPGLTHAADIDVDFTVTTADFSHDQPALVMTARGTTYRDVEEGKQPGLLIETPAGRWRLDMTVSFIPPEQPDEEESVLWELEIWDHHITRTGREKTKLMFSPSLVTAIDEPASVKMGARIPYDGPDGVEFMEPMMEVEVRWVETP
jgi:hypothetical protein